MRGNRLLHLIDRYIGIILVRFLSLFKTKRSFPTIDSIGLIKLGGIGDLIVLSGVIKDLKITYPSASITLFCGKDNKVIAPLLPGLSHIEVINPFKSWEAIRKLKKSSLSLLIDYGQWSRLDPLLVFFSGAAYSIGFKTAHQYRHYLYDAYEEHSDQCHEIDNFRALTAKAHVSVGQAPSLQTENKRAASDKPYVIFHPWPSGLKSELKEWPEERWIALGQFLLKNDFAVFITGGHSDVIDSERLARQIGAISLAGKTTFETLAAYIAGAHCVISVNTGIMHFAACFTTPLIALNGPTSPTRWGPLSPKAIALTSEIEGCHYLNLGFEYPRKPPRCMEGISLERVIEALQSFNLLDRM